MEVPVEIIEFAFKNNLRSAVIENRALSNLSGKEEQIRYLDFEFALLVLLADANTSIQSLNQLKQLNWYLQTKLGNGTSQLHPDQLLTFSIAKQIQKIVCADISADIVFSWIQDVLNEQTVQRIKVYQ